MRQLEVVAVSDDGTHVLLAASSQADKPSHSVRIDGRLAAAIRGELEESAERRESELSPKEIQARLRAGESVEELARVAKVPAARVLRYAGPVLSERERIVGQAGAAIVQRPRGPQSDLPLSELVQKALAVTAGLRPDTVEWTARRRDDGAWVVVVSYKARGGARSALWLWHPAEQLLTSMNALATRLTTVSPSKTRRASTSTVRSRPAPTSRPAKKAKPAVKVKAKPARVVKTAVAARPVKATKVTSGSKPAKATPLKVVPTKAIAGKPAAKRPSKAAPRSADRAAETGPPLVAAPEVAPDVAESVPPTARKPGERVVVPSWSDVLLGVQSPTTGRGRRRS